MSLAGRQPDPDRLDPFPALQDYLQQKRAGLDPVFTKDSIDDIECWDEPNNPVSET